MSISVHQVRSKCLKEKLQRNFRRSGPLSPGNVKLIHLKVISRLKKSGFKLL